MKRRELAMMSVEELKQKEKSLKLTLAIFGGVLTTVIIAAIVLAIQRGFSLFMILPLVFFPFLLNTKKNLDSVKTELRGRAEEFSPYTNLPRN